MQSTVLVVSLLVVCTVYHSARGQAPAVPGIAQWEAAIRAHSQAEGRLSPSSAPSVPTFGTVPGMSEWQAQQAAVLAAEQRLLQQTPDANSILPQLGESATKNQPQMDNPERGVKEVFSNSLEKSLLKFIEAVQKSKPSGPSRGTPEVRTKLDDRQTTAELLSSNDGNDLLSVLLASLQPKTTTTTTTTTTRPKTSRNNDDPYGLLAALTGLKPRPRGNSEDIFTLLGKERPDVSDPSALIGSEQPDNFLDQLLLTLALREELTKVDPTYTDEEEVNAIDDDLVALLLEGALQPSELQRSARLEKVNSGISLGNRPKVKSIFEELASDYEDDNTVVVVDTEADARSEISVLGGFLHEEISSASDQTQQLAQDLDDLLAVLEEEKERELQLLANNFAQIKNQLKSTNSFSLHQDKNFVGNVLQRFAFLGLPLREEDIELTSDSQAREVLMQNVIRASDQVKSIALSLKERLLKGSETRPLSANEEKARLLELEAIRGELEELLTLVNVK